MTGIQKVSRIIRISSLIGMILVPIYHIVTFVVIFYASSLEAIQNAPFEEIAILGHIIPFSAFSLISTRWLLLANLLMNSTVLVICLYHLMGLFREYEEGNIFTALTVFRIRWIGITLVFYAIMLWVNKICGAIILDLTGGMSSSYSDPIPTLLIGIIVLMHAWIMEESRKLKEEQDFTI